MLERTVVEFDLEKMLNEEKNSHAEKMRALNDKISELITLGTVMTWNSEDSTVNMMGSMIKNIAESMYNYTI